MSYYGPSRGPPQDQRSSGGEGRRNDDGSSRSRSLNNDTGADNRDGYGHHYGGSGSNRGSIPHRIPRIPRRQPNPNYNGTEQQQQQDPNSRSSDNGPLPQGSRRRSDRERANDGRGATRPSDHETPRQSHRQEEEEADDQRTSPKENEKRYNELLQAVKGKSSAERRDIFRKLSWKDKLAVQGFPNFGANPLQGPFPKEVSEEKTVETKDWGDKKVEAAKYAAEKAYYKWQELECSSEDDSDAQDERDPYPNVNFQWRGGPSGGGDAKRQRMTNPHEDFFLALPHCLLFDAAFRCWWEHDSKLCWCPCGAYMRPWQKYHGLNGSETEEAFRKCNKGEGKKPKDPAALLAHLRAFGEHCALHYGVEEYLKKLYEDYNGKDYIGGGKLAHSAIYKKSGGEKFERARSAEYERGQRMFDETFAELQASKEREQKMREENEAFKERMKELEKINKDRKEKLEERNMVLEKLGLAGEKEEPDPSERELECFRFQLQSYVAFLDLKARKYLKLIPEPRDKPLKPPSPPHFRIEVEDNFKLQDLFDDIYNSNERSTSYFFRNISGERFASILVVDWVVEVGDKEGRDEGGLTKLFFDAVWQQLPTLAVVAQDVKVKLFDFDDTSSKVVGFVPASNEQLEFKQSQNISNKEREKALEKAQRYYRAIGRIMCHSLIRDCVLPWTTMPPFYRNVLFRECDLQDIRYNHRKVLKDIEALGGNFAQQYEALVGLGLSVDGVQTDDPDEVVTKENFVSKFIYSKFIEGRSIAIDALREGITLGGYANLPAILRTMPEKTVGLLVTAPEKIKVQDVINVLSPVYQNSDAADEKEIIDQVFLFEDILKPMIVKRSKDDVSYLPTFVSFITGMTFIPHKDAKPGYKIIIEFSDSFKDENALPHAKTCENTLILPSHSYRQDRERFEKLLDECFALMKIVNMSDE